jgi:hypothetical protein
MPKHLEGPTANIALTVRLEAELAERLRAACFHHRLKKQAVLRQALAEFINLVQGSSRPRRARHAIEHLAIPPAAPLTVAEKVLLDYDANQALRRLVYERQTHKQHVARVALLHYLEVLERST